MEEGRRRKRIPITKGELLPIEDKDAYVRNKCSERARKIGTVKPNFDFNIWFDQHYQVRTQFGDDQGVRPGIEHEKVESLVKKAMNHLMTYSAIVKGFTFINSAPNNGRNERVVLQEDTNYGLLNVVIEVHLIEVGSYEVTVKTAMCTDSFLLSDGQYAIQIIDNESILKKKERQVLREIYNL